MSNTVFDFEGQWSKVLEVLDHPLAIRALNAGMTGWGDLRGRNWSPELGPWSYARYDQYWHTNAQNNFEASGQSNEHRKWCKTQGCPDGKVDPKGCDAWLNSQAAWDQYDVMIKPFYPQPHTIEWYRCYGACHWLAVWNGAIGELIFPSYQWTILKGEEHSTALGTSSNDLICMDILWGHDHTFSEIEKGLGDDVAEFDVLEDIEWLETRPYRKEYFKEFV